MYRILTLLRQYVDIGPGPNLHTWGAALLSKVKRLVFARNSLLIGCSSLSSSLPIICYHRLTEN